MNKSIRAARVALVMYLAFAWPRIGLAAPAGDDAGPDATEAPLVLDVRDFGAVGDGVADDTEAFKKAFAAIQRPAAAGELFIPAGVYRITETLVLKNQQGLAIRGQGSTKFLPLPSARASRCTVLVWDGEPGGVLLETAGIGTCLFERFNLCGIAPEKRKQFLRRNPRKKPPQAGILYLGHSTGAGNMINRMHMLGFFYADAGIQMARSKKEMCASDIHLSSITFAHLGTGFKVTNNQGVDYLFNFLFATNCERVLHFELGGTLLVNNAQATCCGCFLEINGGGRNAGNYLCQNVHVEGHAGRGNTQRWQVLRVSPYWDQANVHFTSFVDAQWRWARNQSEKRNIPLCEIGPGANVVFQSSIFNSPVASVQGVKGKPATLVIRESSFGYVKPEKGAFQANEYGYYKTINCRDDNCDGLNLDSVLPDVTKWPRKKPVTIPAGSSVELDTEGIEMYWHQNVKPDEQPE